MVKRWHLSILSSLDVISRKILVSSTNRNVSEFMFSGKSLMYRTKRSGPRTLPWVIPLSTRVGKESSPLTLTSWVRPLRNALIQFRISPLIPHDVSLPISIECFRNVEVNCISYTSNHYGFDTAI